MLGLGNSCRITLRTYLHGLRTTAISQPGGRGRAYAGHDGPKRLYSDSEVKIDTEWHRRLLNWITFVLF